MPLTQRRFRQLTNAIGGLLTVMGASLLAGFVLLFLTGANVMAALPGNPGGVGLLLTATVGAFALPLGLALFGQPTPATSRLRIAGFALGLMAVLRLLAVLTPSIRAEVGVIPLVEFFVLGGVSLVALCARPTSDAPIELHTTLDLDASAAQTWRVLAERFGEVATFASGLQSSMLDRPVGTGAVRTCETKPFGPFAAATLTEKLVEFSPEAMRFTYVAGGGLPGFISGATNRWSVQALGPNHCRVVSHASIELVWWAVPFATVLGWSIHSEVGRFGDDLRHHVAAQGELAAKAR
jgi:hypothetical protein